MRCGCAFPAGPARNHSFWLEKLAGCGYCLDHWVAFVLVPVYRSRLFEAWWLLDYSLTAILTAWLAVFQCAASCWLTETSGE